MSSTLFFLSLPSRGLCAVYRAAAGQLSRSTSADGDAAVADVEDRNWKNNAHWLPDENEQAEAEAGGGTFLPEPSKRVVYYDAASLYPSSGE